MLTVQLHPDDVGEVLGCEGPAGPKVWAAGSGESPALEAAPPLDHRLGRPVWAYRQAAGAVLPREHLHPVCFRMCGSASGVRELLQSQISLNANPSLQNSSGGCF